MNLNILAVQALVKCIVILAMGLFIYFQNRESQLNRLFALLCLSLGLWAGAGFMEAGAPAAGQAHYWHKIEGLFMMWPAPIVLHFTLIFTGRGEWLKHKSVYLLMYLPPVVFLVVDFSTNLISREPVKKFGGYTH